MKLPAKQQKGTIVLRVNNLEHSIHFYTASLGCLMRGHDHMARTAQLVLGVSSIDLIETHGSLGRQVGPTPQTQTYNSNHFTLLVSPATLPSLISRISSAWQPANNPVMKYDAEAGGWSIHCFDPDGNRISLVGP